MKKILNHELSNKTLKIIFVIGMILLLIPIFIVSLYSHPFADDFTYGYYTHAFWGETGSLLETLRWAFSTVHKTYDTWQGTFSSAFFMSISPAVFNEDVYWCTSIIMLGILGISILQISKVFLGKLLKISKKYYHIVSIIVYLVVVEQMYAPASGIYWYNSAIHYTFMQSMLFLLICHLVESVLEEDKKKKVLFIILTMIEAIIVSGSNYITVLLGSISLVFLLVLAGIKDKKKIIYMFPAMVIYYIGIYFNITAYGNQIRGAYFEGLSAVEAIKKSFSAGTTMGLEFFSIFLLLALVILFPTIWNMLEKTNFSFRFPWLISIGSYCFISASFTPSFYAMGSIGVDRTINTIKIVFHILIFVNYIYWIGYFRKKQMNNFNLVRIKQKVSFYLICLLLVVFFFVTCENRGKECLSYEAYASLKSGIAQGYDKQYERRLKVLNSDEKDIEFNAYTYQPSLVFFGDLSEDANDWKNNAVERWYGKDSVRIRVY